MGGTSAWAELRSRVQLGLEWSPTVRRAMSLGIGTLFSGGPPLSSVHVTMHLFGLARAL